MNKAARQQAIGVTITSIAVFQLFAENYKAALNIRHHNAAQLQAWNDVAGEYETALAQASGNLGAPTRSQMKRVNDRFKDYALSLGLDPSTVQKKHTIVEGKIMIAPNLSGT